MNSTYIREISLLSVIVVLYCDFSPSIRWLAWLAVPLFSYLAFFVVKYATASYIFVAISGMLTYAYAKGVRKMKIEIHDADAIAFWDKNAVIGALYFGLVFIVSLLLVTSRRDQGSSDRVSDDAI